MDDNKSSVQQIPQSQDSAAAAVNVKKTNKKKIIWCAIGAAALLLTAGLVGYKLYRNYEDEKALNLLIDQTINVETYYNGISVQGVDLGGKTQEEAKKLLAAVEPTVRDKIDITVTCNDKQFKLTQANFTFTFDTDEVLQQAYAFARSGDRKERYQQILSLSENPQTFTILAKRTADDSTVQAFVDDIASQCNTAPVDATVSAFQPSAQNKFTYTEGTDGVEIDRADLLSKLKTVMDSSKKEGTIAVMTNTIPYTIKAADLKATTQKISEFTTVSTNSSAADHNMSLALAAANGKVLQPGELFSFNGTTGDTTTSALGYVKAGAIANNTHIEAYGGGICQSATTIYGAAMRANMEIVTRYNHRWRSTYVDIGQDATVDYPSTDFQFRNSSAYPIYIASWMSGKTLHVEFYGFQPSEWDRIEVRSWQTDYIAPPADIIIVDETMAPGTKELVNGGACGGYKASGEKVFYKNGAVVKTEPINSSYYMEGAAEYHVGPAS